MTDTPEASAAPPAPIGRARRTAIGAISVAVALGAQEFVAGLTGLASLMGGTADWIISIAPGRLAEWAITTLEYWTKRLLIIGIATVLLVAGMGVALVGTMWRRIAYVAVAVVGLIVTAAGSAGVASSAANAVVALTAGLTVDAWLRNQQWSSAGRAPDDGPADAGSRRRFITGVAALGALAVTAAIGGRRLIELSIRRVARRDDVVLPSPSAAVAPVGPMHEFSVEGLESVVTPNDRFYVVDITALNPPEVDLASWTLTVGGMVDEEIVLTYEDLLGMDLVEQYATLACVSNKVGGRLVGNARWLGIPMSLLLEMAGADPRAEQVAAFGADGFSTGFPLAAVYDRESMLAIGMNGEPLPYKNGFPARLVVPGYYGFVSAAKWVERIELTTWDDHDAYWVKLGWNKHAPIETQSRIDSPRNGVSFAAGDRMIAGVAWAPFLGISRVEVSVDGGPWTDAELSAPLGKATWRQWQIPWSAPAGTHTITVRATDGTGATQTDEVRAPVPAGATGHHTVTVTAE